MPGVTALSHEGINVPTPCDALAILLFLAPLRRTGSYCVVFALLHIFADYSQKPKHMPGDRFCLTSHD